MQKWLISFIIIIFVFLVSGKNPVQNDTASINEVENTIVPEVDFEAEEKQNKLDAYFTRLHKNCGFNGNVLIAQKGNVLLKKTYGYSNLKKRDTLQYNSTFQIASVSKQFTAMAIMMLKERGLLSYEDTVQKFFPDFPYKNITVRLLLIHRSGLPNYIYFTDEIIKDKMTPISNKKVIEMFTKRHPVWYYPPNKRFDYSNTGYMLLAAIVEEVSGKPFSEFMKDEIFEPLGMKNTVVYSKCEKPEICHKTTGYLYYRKEAEDNFLNGVVGDKGIYSSIEDLFLWDQALYSDKLVKQSTLQEAFEPSQKKFRVGRKNYGFGWRMYNKDDGKKVLYHGGWWQGYQSLLLRVTEDKTTVIILKNKKTSLLVKHQDIFNILYPEPEVSIVDSTVSAN